MRVKRIRSHFKDVDPVIYAVIKEMELVPFLASKRSTGYFKKLCREIISQQLAGKAARAIVKRFDDLFKESKVTPSSLLAFSEQELRDVGMSWAKARYIRDLALKISRVKSKLIKLLISGVRIDPMALWRCGEVLM